MAQPSWAAAEQGRGSCQLAGRWAALCLAYSPMPGDAQATSLATAEAAEVRGQMMEGSTAAPGRCRCLQPARARDAQSLEGEEARGRQDGGLLTLGHVGHGREVAAEFLAVPVARPVSGARGGS